MVTSRKRKLFYTQVTSDGVRLRRFGIADGIKALRSRSFQCGLSDRDESQTIDAFSSLDDSRGGTFEGCKPVCPDATRSIRNLACSFHIDNLEE